MHILLSSYSFGANRGSEAGVGWNVAKGLSQRGHQVTVLTTSEFAYLNHPAIEKENLSIKLIEQDFCIRQFASSRAYRLWQKKIGDTIIEETSRHPYDLVHHITFNQYRHIKDIFAVSLPYIIGPIGGAELIPPSLLRYGNIPLSLHIKELLRYCPWDTLPLIYRCRQQSSRGIVLTSNKATASRLKKLPQPVRVCPAIAIHEHEIITSPKLARLAPYILFDGGLSRPQKGTWLALRALAKLWKKGVRVPIRMVGIPPSDATQINQYAIDLELPSDSLQLYPTVDRDTMLKWMQEALVMLSTVYRDSGSMALLEALAQGCRIVCLDIPSQKWLPEQFCHKVAVQPTSSAMEEALASALQQEIAAPAYTEEWHKNRVQWIEQNMTWDARLDTFEGLYRQILSKKPSA